MVDKTGTGAPERIEGTALSDSLVGLGGDDPIVGFAGHETPMGTEGADLFVFSPRFSTLDATHIFGGSSRW